MGDETPPRKTRLYGSIDPRELLSLDGPATFADDMELAKMAAKPTPASASSATRSSTAASSS